MYLHKTCKNGVIYVKLKKCSAACLGRCGMGQGGSPKPLSGATLASHTDCAAPYNVHSGVEKSTVHSGENPCLSHRLCSPSQCAQVHSGEKEHLSHCAQWETLWRKQQTPLTPRTTATQLSNKWPMQSNCTALYHMKSIFHWFCANSTVLSYQPVKHIQSINCK